MRRLAGLATAVGVSWVLAGCGGGAAPTAPDALPPAPPVAVAPAPPEPVVPAEPAPESFLPFEVPDDATPFPMPTAVVDRAPATTATTARPTSAPAGVAAPRAVRTVAPPAPAPKRSVQTTPAPRPAGPAPTPRAAKPTPPAKPTKPAKTRKQTPAEKQTDIEVITPRPGMRNPKPARWERVEVLNERRLRVHYAAGVAPCNVLDSVRVDYRPATVVVTLYVGSDPKQTDRVCAAVANEKAVDVRLVKPLAGRKVVDGAAAALTPPAAAPGRSTSEAMQVRPTPGAVQTRTTAWDRAEALGERTVRIWFTTGAPPCSVLDRVKVDYAADAVTITLITGRSRAAAGQACMTALRPAYVDVTLTEALAGRRILDGAKS